MRAFISSLILFLALSQSLSSQTRTDSIAGKYTRHTWNGVGFTNIDYGNGTSAEIAGYTISTTDEALQLDKNHCAALTVYTQPGNYGFSVIWGNPVVYYGIWKMSGDTAVVTYTKSYSTPLFFIYGTENSLGGITKMDHLMQRKYLWEDGRLTAFGDNENYLFYKEDESIQ